ncbi:restriction endonuclease subunit S [Lactococcus sp. LG592]|uniref:restriction endonuclease subunit S n=1 Tax=Lactococcus sp. LG592 TaxID=2816911 RepID=UPI001A8FF152|nr:restriction endonuclease subunit S [Lactococcus sp. LG592]
MKKAPELRFKGFSDDWEQRKLGDITKRVIRKNKDLDTTLPLTISAQEGLIDQNEFFNKTVASRDVSGYYLVRNGEFAYNKSYSKGFPWGAVKRLNRYNMGVLSTLYIVFKPTNIDSDFLEKYYDTAYWHKEVSKHAAEGARNHGLLNIAATDFFKTELVIPKRIEEQQRIGSFFKQLDETITLHQRKLEKLKQLKLAYLQQLFPKNGENTPRIRFAYFEENWEQRKAKEIFIAKVKKGKPNLPVLSVTQDFGVVYRNEVGIDIKYDNSTLSNYKIIEPGDFVISLRSFQGGFELSDKLGITSPAYTIFIPKNLDHHNQLYWKAQFKTKKFIDSLKIVTFGIRDGKSISFSEFGDLKIMYPIDVDEQRHIGILLQKLNQTLALHQSKIDKLKSIKQSLLQKMFI